MNLAEKLGLFIRSAYSAQVVALVVTLPVALAWFGYAAWWWFKLADWVEVAAQVDHVEWATETGGGKSNGSIAAGCYRFTTRQGEAIQKCGHWDEGWDAHPGDQRQIVYNPMRPRQIERVRAARFKWPVRIVPIIYVFATLFYGVFVYSYGRTDRLLAGPCQTVHAKIVDIVDDGYSSTEDGSVPMASLVCRWRDPDSGKDMEFQWRKRVESIEEESVVVGDFAVVRFSTEDPRTYQVERIKHDGNGTGESSPRRSRS